MAQASANEIKGDTTSAFAWAADAPLLALLFVAPLTLGGFGETPFLVAWLLLAAGWLVHLYHALFIAREIRWPRTWLNPVLMLMLIAVLAAWTTTVSTHASTLEFSRLAWGALAFWLLASRPGDQLRRRLYVIALVAGAAVAAWVSYRHYMMTRPVEADWREFGTFTNPNFLAGYLIMVTPIAMAGLADRWHRWAPAIWGLVAALLLVALALTGSRGGWLSFAIALVVFALLAAQSTTRPRRWTGVLLAGVVFVIAVGLAAPPVRGRIGASFGPQSHSHMFRVLTWRGTINMIRHHPWLGTGPGTFRLAYRQYAIGGYTTLGHENYLQVAAESGAVAGAAFLGLVLAVLATTTAAFRRLAERSQRLLMAGAIAGLIGFAVHGLFDSTWYINAIMLTFWSLPALALVTMRGSVEATDRRREVRISTPAKIGAIALVVMLLVALITPVTRAARAQAYMNAAEEAVRQGDLAAAVAQARAAIASDPGSAQAHRQLARLLGAQPSTLKQAPQQAAIAWRLEPTNPENLLLLAEIYRRLGEAGRQHEYLLDALRLSPLDVSARLALADLLRKQGNDLEARRHYRKIVNIERSPYERYRAIPERVETAYAFAHCQLGQYALDGGRGIPRAGPWVAAREFDAALRVLSAYDASVRARLGRILQYQVPPDRLPAILDQLVTKHGPRWADIFDRLDEIDPQLADAFRALVGYTHEQARDLYDLRARIYQSLVAAYTQRNEPERAEAYQVRLEALRRLAPVMKPPEPGSRHHAE